MHLAWAYSGFLSSSTAAWPILRRPSAGVGGLAGRSVAKHVDSVNTRISATNVFVAIIPPAPAGCETLYVLSLTVPRANLRGCAAFRSGRGLRRCIGLRLWLL